METLELKHLSCYLPYKLKVYDTISSKSKVMNLGQGQSVNWVGVKTVLNYYKSGSFIYKPILRPLSDLKKSNIEFTEYFKNRFDMDEWTYLWDVPYSDMEKLFKNHFDVFSLIDKGLAIDISAI